MTNQLIRHCMQDYYQGDRSDHLRRCLIRAREHFNDDADETMSVESKRLDTDPARETNWQNIVIWLENHIPNT